MLGTLFKYDFLALGRTLGVLQLCVFVAGLFGSFLIGISYRAASTSWDSSLYSSTYGTFESVFASVSSMIGSLIFAAVFASSIVTLFLIARHYYKNFFGAEGYLTFTLPVKTGQLLMSKTLSGVLWSLINVVVILLVCVALSLFGFTDELVDVSVLKSYGELFAAILTPLGAATTAELVFLTLASTVMNVLLIYASISLGCSVARTHKVLASIGFYLLFGFVLNTIMSVILFSSAFGLIDSAWSSSYNSDSWFYILQYFMIPAMSCTVAVVFVLYFISRKPISGNLNLD